MEIRSAQMQAYMFTAQSLTQALTWLTCSFNHYIIEGPRIPTLRRNGGAGLSAPIVSTQAVVCNAPAGLCTNLEPK